MSAHAKKDVGKGEHLFILQTCMDTVGIGVAVSHEAENRSLTKLSNTRLVNIPKGLYILLQRHLFIRVHCYSIHII